MRVKWIASVLHGVAIALGASSGCGGDPVGETDLAKLPPPASGVIAKPTQLKGPRPKFGAPPKGQRPEPTTVLQ
jgi:hypothetical protein